MKLLTLILYLATGDQPRLAMPAWECHAIVAEIERGWLAGNSAMHQESGQTIVEVRCVPTTWEESLTVSSNGDCEVTS